MFTCFTGFGTGWIGWLGHGAWMLLFWGAIIAGIVWLVKSMSGSRNDGNGNDSALDHLKLRYVNGEIDREEYRERRQKLL